MFSLINIGERAGSGLPMIYKAWADSDYAMPDIIEKENPDRVCFTLPVKALGVNEPIMPDTNNKQYQIILDYIKLHGEVTANIVTSMLDIKERRARAILHDMQKGGLVEKLGAARSIRYILGKHK